LKARFAVAISSLAALACRDIAGIKPLAFSDAGSAACNAPEATVLHTSGLEYDQMYAGGGFVYLESTGGVERCAESGCASGTTAVVNVGASETFGGSALAGSSVDYSESDAAGTGQIHSVGGDGTNDQVVGSNLESPYYVAVTGSRVFWADDSYTDGTGAVLDSVGCIGCTGTTSTPWISSAAFAGGIYAMVADASMVYVLADDLNIQNYELLACSTTTACGASPTLLVPAVDPSTTETQLASDGTYAYLARADHADVVRIDKSGNLVQLVTSQDVAAIAVDASAGNLYYGTSNGVVGRVSTSGTGTPTTITCVADPIVAMAVDSAVFFLAGALGGTLYSIPK
jgi:hypothetical protein